MAKENPREILFELQDLVAALPVDQQATFLSLINRLDTATAPAREVDINRPLREFVVLSQSQFTALNSDEWDTLGAYEPETQHKNTEFRPELQHILTSWLTSLEDKENTIRFVYDISRIVILRNNNYKDPGFLKPHIVSVELLIHEVLFRYTSLGVFHHSLQLGITQFLGELARYMPDDVLAHVTEIVEAK